MNRLLGTGIVDLVQELVDNLCPCRKYIVGKTCPLARIVSPSQFHYVYQTVSHAAHVQARQRMGNWRRGFLTRANTAAAVEFERIQDLNPKSTRDAVRIWAVAATDPLKGEVYWEHPTTGQVSLFRRCATRMLRTH